jgi:hypothetical protein
MHLVLGLVSAGLGVSLVPSSIAQIKHKYIVFKKADGQAFENDDSTCVA